MLEQNSYQAYVDTSTTGMSPIRLVTALYEGAIQACVKGQECFETNDIMGRSQAVNKLVSILTELMITLDHEKGGELSGNLKRLYSYMQQRALTAHLKKDVAPLKEVERLLRNMIEAWYKVAETHGESVSTHDEGELIPDAPSFSQSPSYGGYGEDVHDSLLGHSFSF